MYVDFVQKFIHYFGHAFLNITQTEMTESERYLNVL